MDNYDIAHEWANCTDNNASAAAPTLYYANGCIYSYGDHFMIAKHVRNEQGRHAVLFTERTYSRTTSKHVSIVRAAANHLDKLFVPDPALTATELFGCWHLAIINIAYHLENAKRPAKYALEIQHVFNEAKRYADFFGYEMPEHLDKAGAIADLSGLREHLAKERELREQAEAKAQNQRLLAQKQQLKDWRSFKRTYISTADGFDYLRYHAGSQQVETTQRVEFSVTAALQLYRFVMATIAKGGCTNCGETFLGRYTVTEINAAFIRVGCHKVALKEIKSFAKKQGWS
jgi:hypothetical protein